MCAKAKHTAVLHTTMLLNCFLSNSQMCRCLTGGLVTLANTSMSGMCSMAALLFPQLPVKGVDYEDIAVSLVKALHSNTDAPSTWARPGDFSRHMTELCMIWCRNALAVPL